MSELMDDVVASDARPTQWYQAGSRVNTAITVVVAVVSAAGGVLLARTGVGVSLGHGSMIAAIILVAFFCVVICTAVFAGVAKWRRQRS
jgi:hypothetical protein